MSRRDCFFASIEARLYVPWRLPDEITLPGFWLLTRLCLFLWFVDDQGRFVPERDAVTAFKFRGTVG